MYSTIGFVNDIILQTLFLFTDFQDDSGPPKSDAFKPRLPPKSTTFRKFYDRGDLPIYGELGRHGEILWRQGVSIV